MDENPGSTRVLCIALARTAGIIPIVWRTENLGYRRTFRLGNSPGDDQFSTRHFSEAEYYRAPVDNYRTYPVYRPDREQPGYWDFIRARNPEPLSGSENLRQGDEIDVPYSRLFDADSISLARSPKYFRDNEHRLVFRPDGTIAMYGWVVTPQGVGLGITACSSCHTRYLHDGTAIAGAAFAQKITDSILERMSDRLLNIAFAGDSPQMALYRQFGVPWILDDIHGGLRNMPADRIGELFDALPPGVSDRPNGSVYYPTKVLDLIGIRDRKYIDHTATHRNRGAADIMRYAALVEYSDAMQFGTHVMWAEQTTREVSTSAGRTRCCMLSLSMCHRCGTRTRTGATVWPPPARKSSVGRGAGRATRFLSTRITS